MKKIWLLGRREGLSTGLSRRMSMRGYSVRQIQDVKELKKLLRNNSPDFVLCTGRIQIDDNGNYYLEM